MSTIDTTNRFLVGSRGDKISIMVLHTEISKEQALNLAAYLVCMADMSQDHEDFNKVLEAIEKA